MFPTITLEVFYFYSPDIPIFIQNIFGVLFAVFITILLLLTVALKSIGAKNFDSIFSVNKLFREFPNKRIPTGGCLKKMSRPPMDFSVRGIFPSQWIPKLVVPSQYIVEKRPQKGATQILVLNWNLISRVVFIIYIRL